MSKEWSTKGLFPSRKPDSELYDLGYFLGEKTDLDIQYPADGSYLDPESQYQYKFKDILAWIGSYIPKGRILDAGCGPGHLNYWSQKLNLPYSFVNSDVSREILTIAKDKNSQSSVVNNEVNLLPFKPLSFEGALFSDVLLHLWPEDAFQAVKQASGLLKPSGRIFIKIGNRHSLSKGVKKEHDHIWLPTIKELNQMLTATNFDSTTISHYTRGFPVTRHYRQLTGNDLRLSIGGSSIFITAQKFD